MQNNMNNNTCGNGFGATMGSIFPTFEHGEKLMIFICF